MYIHTAFEITPSGALGKLVHAGEAIRTRDDTVRKGLAPPHWMHPAGHDVVVDQRSPWQERMPVTAFWLDVDVCRGGPEHRELAKDHRAIAQLDALMEQQKEAFRALLRHMPDDQRKEYAQDLMVEHGRDAARAVFPYGLSAGGQPLTWTGAIQSWDDYDHQRKEKA